MTRRQGPDPERIYEARRAAVSTRLTHFNHLDQPDAEDWITAWEREAEAEGIERLAIGFWNAGFEWIAARRSAPNQLRARAQTEMRHGPAESSGTLTGGKIANG